MLLLVPQAYSRSRLRVGRFRWRTTLSITLSTATSGVITGVMLAFARVAGETAPLLFTAFGNQFWNWKYDQPTAALSLQIFTYAISPFDEWHRQAWAGALVLIVLIVERSGRRSLRRAPTVLAFAASLIRLMGVGITVEQLNAFYGKTQALFDINLPCSPIMRLR